MAMIKLLRNFVNHPLSNVVVTACLTYAAALEVWRDIGEPEAKPGAHHGVLVYAVYHLLKHLTKFFDHWDDLRGRGKHSKSG